MASTRRGADQDRRGLRYLLLPAMTIAVVAVSAGRAEAQFGFGYGIGFGLGHQTPASVEYLNQRSLVNAANAATNRQPGPFSGGNLSSNPNSYLNRRREVALQERFNISNQQGIESWVSPGLATPVRQSRNARANPITGEFQRPAGAPAPAAPAQVADAAPLDRFFNAYRELVWPADAPYHDEFKPLRETSDAASLSTLQEAEKNGIATVATATRARESLLDYGRPALRHVRESSTSQVADGFHAFLLSLYASLEQAALVPRAPRR